MGLPVTPINPSTASITVEDKSYSTVPSPSALANPTETALSIITPPAITRKILEEAKEAGIRAVWMQPGSFEQQDLDFALNIWKGRAVAGDGGAGDEGWCVLVDGESALLAAGKL